MGGGSGGTQNTVAIPWEGVQPFLTQGFERLYNESFNVPQYYPGSAVAEQSPYTEQGIEATAGAAGQQADVASQTGQQFQFFTGDALSPDTNPFLSETAYAATKPVFENLTKNVLPQIGRGGVEVGGFGGTAHANLQGDAIDKAVQRALDETFGLYSSAYESGADRATDLLRAAPIIQGAFAAPGASLTQAGGMQDAYSQALIDAEIARHNFGETAEMDWLTNYLSTLQGVPFGQSVSGSGMGPSTFNKALSGATGGAALQAMIPALGFSQPWLLPLMMAGGATFL